MPQMVSKAVLLTAREHARFDPVAQAGCPQCDEIKVTSGRLAFGSDDFSAQMHVLRHAAPCITTPPESDGPMNFASDNSSGVSPRVMAGFIAANDGNAMPYGADHWSAQVEPALSAVFERDCTVYLVPSGTAANALALAALTPPFGAVFCHADAHISGDECGAPEFFTAGAKLVGLPGRHGRIAPETLESELRRYPRGFVKQVQPATLSLTQATEAGTVYRPDEIAELAAIAHAAGLRVHMDGARFANAMMSLGCSAADLTWRAGIDVLSFGATKNGTFCCEAVILFDSVLAADFAFRRKRAGHTLSKARFLAAQMIAYLDGDHWLSLAAHSNAMARRLAAGLIAVPGVRMPIACEANEIFPIMARKADGRLRAAGATYYDWGGRGLDPAEGLLADEMQLRLVTSFTTTPEEVDRFIAEIAAALA